MAREKRKTRRRGRRQLNPLRAWRKATTFYPHGDEDGTLGPVTPVVPVQFQPIIPRYDLSTSETREAGVGPAFDSAPYFADAEPGFPLPDRVAEERANEEEPQRGRPTPGTGERLDLDA